MNPRKPHRISTARWRLTFDGWPPSVERLRTAWMLGAMQSVRLGDDINFIGNTVEGTSHYGPVRGSHPSDHRRKITDVADRLRASTFDVFDFQAEEVSMPANLRMIDNQGLAGGFTLGAVQAGFELVAKLELPGGFGVENCEANRHLLGDGWTAYVGSYSEWPDFDDISYVMSNPPCSGFSLLNTSKKNNSRGADSGINDCMRAMIYWAARQNRGKGPDFIVMESVQGAFKQGRGLMQELRTHMETNTGRRYRLTHFLLAGATVGAAAMRHRYFMVLHTEPFGIEVTPRESVVTYRDSIGDLIELESQWEPQKIKHPPSQWLIEENMLRDDGMIDAHLSMDTPYTKSLAFSRWQAVLDWWEPGEIFENALTRAVEQCGEAPGPWETQPNLGTDRFGFQQPKRLKWDKPGYVITGGGLWQFVHPSESRWLSTRELARIQGFPDTWTFDAASGVKIRQASMWIGKGVPVQSGRFVSRWIRSSIEGNPGENQGEKIGDDEYLIDVTSMYRDWM